MGIAALKGNLTMFYFVHSFRKMQSYNLKVFCFFFNSYSFIFITIMITIMLIIYMWKTQKKTLETNIESP